jgi:hypothetical protein
MTLVAFENQRMPSTLLLYLAQKSNNVIRFKISGDFQGY